MALATLENPPKLNTGSPEIRWLEQALETGGLGAWELDLVTGAVTATAVTRTIFGFDPGQPLTRADILGALHPDDRIAATCLFETGLGRDQEFRIPRNGGEKQIELKGRLYRDPAGCPVRVAGIVRDISECYRTKERLDSLRTELLRVARLNDLGAMASALAHELNQPLAAASNYLHAAERFLEHNREQARNAITKAQAQFVRTKDIIQRIRGFVGQGQGERRPEDIETVCREVVDLARPFARSDGVSLFLEIETGLPDVEIDKVQIQQVLLNLLRNAAEAMANGDKRHATIHAGLTEGMVKLSVADTGPGLSPEIAEHLFQPFHSSKKNGMGVGLSLCRKIVESHGGTLWREPSESGAVFAFTLPVVTAAAGCATKMP